MVEFAGARTSTRIKLQKIEDQLGLVTDKVADALKARLMLLKQAYACLIGKMQWDHNLPNQGLHLGISSGLVVPLI